MNLLKGNLFLLTIVCLLFWTFVLPSESYAANIIRVSGFTSPRSRVPLVDPSGNASSDFFEGASNLVNALKNTSKFGSAGVVGCSLDLKPFVTTIAFGSLVSDGNRTVDIFFAGVTNTSLSSSEAQELKSFLNVGGVVYISGSALGSEGPTYNPLFGELGISDNFASQVDFASFEGMTEDPDDTSPITGGPFGNIGPMTHTPFRIINTSSLTRIANGFEEGGIIVMGITPEGLSNNAILAEGTFGSGYLSVMGDSLYVNYLTTDSDNLNYFLNLFALGCKGGKQLNVPLFKQGSAPWGGQEYDSGNDQSLWCGKTIAQCGCATSSIAMVLKYHGVDRDPFGNSTTPESVNNYFKRDEKCGRRGCTSLGYSLGQVIWGAAGQYSRDANENFSTQKIVYSGPSNYDSQNVQSHIEADRPVILRVSGNEHWVVATGIEGNTFLINDPAYNRTALNDPAYGNDAVAARNYQKTASDFSSFEVTSLSPVQILVTDNEERRTGFDSQTSSVVEEIPNSFYYFEDAYDDPTDENPPPPPGSGVYTVLILTPAQDEYGVELVGQVSEEYSFSIHASDVDANIDFNLFEGDILTNREDNKYDFSYNPDPQEEIEFSQKVQINILPFVKMNIIVSKNLFLIPVAILSTPTFDVNNVDTSSLRFGRTGNEESLVSCVPFRIDVNKNRLKDLICLFFTQKSGFQAGDTE